MENLGPILFVVVAILYLIGCVVFAFILWLIYKFVIKVEEKPSFGALYKISFSSGLIAGVLGYVLFRIAAATAILGAGPVGGTDAAALAALMQILSYPLTMAALYIIVGLSISSLLFYAGLYLAHRYHAKSTPKNIAVKASLTFVAVLFLVQGAFFTYAWIAASRGMEAAYGDLSPEEAAAVDAARNLSPEQAAAAQAARRCATQMQQALTLPPEEQEAAMMEATNCMAEAGNTLASASSDPGNGSNAASLAMGESESGSSTLRAFEEHLDACAYFIAEPQYDLDRAIFLMESAKAECQKAATAFQLIENESGRSSNEYIEANNRISENIGMSLPELINAVTRSLTAFRSPDGQKALDEQNAN